MRAVVVWGVRASCNWIVTAASCVYIMLNIYTRLFAWAVSQLFGSHFFTISCCFSMTIARLALHLNLRELSSTSGCRFAQTQCYHLDQVSLRKLAFYSRIIHLLQWAMSRLCVWHGYGDDRLWQGLLSICHIVLLATWSSDPSCAALVASTSVAIMPR